MRRGRQFGESRGVPWAVPDSRTAGRGAIGLGRVELGSTLEDVGTRNAFRGIGSTSLRHPLQLGGCVHAEGVSLCVHGARSDRNPALSALVCETERYAGTVRRQGVRGSLR